MPCVFCILFFNLCFAQKTNTLKIKFNERIFLSNFLKSNTNNSFILRVLKSADSISNIRQTENYIDILNTSLENNLKLEMQHKTVDNDLIKELDSLDGFKELMKKAVENNFGSEFLQQSFNMFGISNFNIKQSDYNEFFVSFSDKNSFEKAKSVLFSSTLSLRKPVVEDELEKIHNCFMKENDLMVKNNYLKKEPNHILIYKDDANMFGNSYEESKCFDHKKVTWLIDNGENFDIFSKLYFVNYNNEKDKNLVDSIIGFDFRTDQELKEGTDGSYFLATVFFDPKGSVFLSEFFSENEDKKNIFIGNQSDFLMKTEILVPPTFDRMIIKLNIFEGNWKKTYELLKFESFRNSSKIQIYN